MTFLFLTKTNWSEPPRIRHQLAQLLAQESNKIIFVEKPHYRLFSKTKMIQESEFLIRVQHPELIHHQLRPLELIQNINSSFVLKKLKQVVNRNNINCVINFNYDYSRILKNLDLPSITIINDDFRAQGKIWMKSTIENEFRKVSKVSNYTLAVSYPLVERLKSYTNKVELFLPWVTDKYIEPEKSEVRDTVLYYGYVSRIDWTVIESILKNGIKLRIVGPKTKKSVKKIKTLTNQFQNLQIVEATSFNEVYLEDIFCSIAPYDLNIENSHMITANNRMFKLLSRGIPMIFTDISALIDAPHDVLRKCKSQEDFLDAIDFFRSHFHELQTSIKNFLKGNYSKDRLNQLNKIINSIV